MNIEIVERPFIVSLIGRSTVHDRRKSFGQELIATLDLVWPVVREKKIQTTGINYAVYETGGVLFAGLVAKNPAGNLDELAGMAGLERRDIEIPRYAYFKYTGSYARLPSINEQFTTALKDMGEREISPRIEIYGHWVEDENKLETEIIAAIQ